MSKARRRDSSSNESGQCSDDSTSSLKLQSGWELDSCESQKDRSSLE